PRPRPVKFSFARLRPPPSRASIAVDLAQTISPPTMSKKGWPAMTTAVLDTPLTYEYDVEDIEYLRHGDKPLLARVFRPRGEGPFPALVECHGGAWCLSDRTTEKLRHQAMASHGIVSIALDFRSGDTDPYPASVIDINYAVRWAKLNAKALKTRPELIGISGQSSGGHLAMLVAMRPNDPRYAATALPPPPRPPSPAL